MVLVRPQNRVSYYYHLSLTTTLPDAVEDREAPAPGRPARRAPKRDLFVAESATVDNKKLKGAE